MSENLRNDGVCAAPNCDCISPCPVVPDDRALVAERDYLRAVVNGVHSALSRARCSCCDSELPWMDDGTKWGPCQKCALKDPAAPVPVQQDAHPSELDPLRHIAHDCKCNPVPVQQDEPEGDEYPRKDGDVLVLGPECIAAEDGSAIIWKGEHYSRSLQDFASDGEGSSADPGSPPARQTAAGSQPSPVPVQQDEPEGVCAFPNCSCTENRCPAKGERGPFCDHGFHPRLCGRCAPVPEAVTDEDEVQCQMCKTVQPRPDKECGHCGAGPKYLCPIHTRPAAAPVQQEPEDECEGCVRLNTQLDEAAKLCAELEADLIAAGGVKNPATGLPVGLAPAVPSVGLRDRLLGIMGTQVKPDPPSLTVMKDAQRRPYSDGFRDGQIMAVNRLRPALSEALSVLHEAGDGEVLRVVRDDDGYTIMLPGDGAWASSSDPRMLESYLALRLSEVAAEAGLPALAPDMPWAGPSAEAGTQDDDENESHAQFLEALAFGWDNDQPEARRLYRIAEVLRLPAPAEAGTQEDSLSQLVSDTGLIREVARANVELIDLSEKINAAVERWTAEAKRRKEDLTASPAEAGTQEDEGNE